ncbi:MAG: hypothetical protein Q9171_004138 [Xanthocarpia ochracea]
MVLPDQTPRLDPSRLPYYGVPYPRNNKFFGRNAELEQIRAAFARRSESIAQPTLSGAGRSKSTSSIKEAGTSPRSLSICGLGGIGKTQLALEYASLYKRQYDAILWVYCQHQASIAESFIQIAADLFPASLSRDSLLCPKLVLQWLQSTGCEWLLVLDNVDEPENLVEYWSWTVNTGSVLITTRNSRLPNVQFSMRLTLEPLSVIEGSAFFSALVEQELSSEWDSQAALEISKRSAGLPLALAQAAAYLKKTRHTLPQYLVAYNKPWHRAHSSRSIRLGPSYSHTLNSVWLLSFRSLSPSAFHVMGVLSVVDPDGVPAVAFESPNTESPIGDTCQCKDAMEEIENMGLAMHDRAKGLLFTHRLVQYEFRRYISYEQLRMALEIASLLLYDYLLGLKAESGSLQHSQGYTQVLPHVHVLQEHGHRVFKERGVGHGKWLTALLDLERSSRRSVNHDDVSDTLSDSKVQSIFSHAESLPSVPTTADAIDMPATAQLVCLFSEDETIRILALKAIETEGDDFFRRLFADMLILYSKDLRMRAKIDAEMKASEWVERERNTVAAALSVVVQEWHAETPKLLGSSNENGPIEKITFETAEEDIDEASSSVATLYKAIRTHETIHAIARELSRDPSVNQIMNDPSPYHVETNILLERVRRFMIDSPAFLQLKENLKKTVSVRIRAQGTPDDLAQESAISEEQPSYENKVQGIWQCECGETVHDDFVELVEGSVEKAMLQLGAPVKASTGPSTTSTWNNIKDVSRDFMTNLANIRTYWGPRKGAAEDGPPDNESELHTGLELDSQRRESDRYLLLCISQWRGYYLTGMVPVDLRIASDDDLFRRMKVEYMTMLGPWRRFLSLRYLKDIRFVQFNIVRNQLIDILVHSRMADQVLAAIPPSNDSDYDYEPKPIDMAPPVGHNSMLHCYRCPKACGQLDFCLRRFPGYKSHTVSIDDDKDTRIAWGIELVEGQDWGFLWVLGFLITASSMIFGIAWTLVMKDIQGGFTVAGYIIALEITLVGTVQFAIEKAV